MNEHEKLANEIIDEVCDMVLKHYDIKPKHITDDTSIKNPALINGTEYYDLESSIAEKIRKLVT